MCRAVPRRSQSCGRITATTRSTSARLQPAFALILSTDEQATVVMPRTTPACVPAPGVLVVIIRLDDAPKVVGGHPISDVFAHRRANFDGIPVMHATVHACVDELGPEIVRLFKDVRGTRDHTVECEADPLAATEVFENSGRRTRPTSVCCRILWMW